MAAVDEWKQKGQKVKDIDPLSIPKYKIKADISQGFRHFLVMTLMQLFSWGDGYFLD